MRKAIVSTMAVMAFIVASGVNAEPAKLPTFVLAVGQMWSIRSASPTTAKVIIGRIESWNGKVAVHVSIIDIPIPQGLPGAGGATRIDHIPFDRAALEASVDHLISKDVPPSSGFVSGYEQWKSAKGGIFTISIEKAIEMMLQTVNRGRG